MKAFLLYTWEMLQLAIILTVLLPAAAIEEYFRPELRR